MLVTIAIFLVLIPAVAILWTFVFTPKNTVTSDDETSVHFEWERRWETAVAGLKSAELEHAIGNLNRDDYTVLREQYMIEASVVIREMELGEKQEEDLLDSIRLEMLAIRETVTGESVDI